MWEFDCEESWASKNWCFWTVGLEKTLESPLDCKEIQPVHPKGNQSSVHWKNWCWSWNSSTLATSCKELIHWKIPWCWEGLGAGGEGDNRGWDGWMASPTQWAWVWVNSGSWWWTRRPGVLWFMGLQRVRHDWATELTDWLTLHWSLRMSFLSLLAILWKSTFKWVYLPFSPLPLASLLLSVICKPSLDNHFALLHFFFLGVVFITASCTMSWTSAYSSSGTLSIRSNPLNLFVTSTV